MNIIKKLASMLIIIGFSLQQTACMRCCVTTDLMKRAENESKQSPKVVWYVDRIDKVVSAYINDKEKELTICVEGKLAEKTVTQQFALKTSLNVEQLKNQPPKGIKYELRNGKIPTIQMERHTIIPSCPEQPKNTRTLMVKNINFDTENVSGNQSQMGTTIEEKLASIYRVNNEKERDFIAKNPEKFQNIDPMEFKRLLQPIYEESDSVFYVSMEKPYSSQYLTYTNYPSLTVQSGGASTIVMSAAEPINRNSSPLNNQPTYVYHEEPFKHVYNPTKFDEQHFVVFKIKEEERKIIPNHFSMNYLALPLGVISDIFLSPFYLLEIILCPPQGCRLVI